MWSPLSPMGCFAGTPLVTIVAYGVLRGHPIEGTHWGRVRDARHHLVTIFWKIRCACFFTIEPEDVWSSLVVTIFWKFWMRTIAWVTIFLKFVVSISLLSSLKTSEAVWWYHFLEIRDANNPLGNHFLEIRCAYFFTIESEDVWSSLVVTIFWKFVMRTIHLVTIFWKLVVLISLLSSLKTSEAVFRTIFGNSWCEQSIW